MGNSKEKEQNTDNERKLSTFEKTLIADATGTIFSMHYIDLGHTFIEKDINLFYYFVDKTKNEYKNKLPVAQDLDYCYNVVQAIVYIARLLRYEQELLSKNILRCNVKLKDLYYEDKPLNKENKEKLEKDLLRNVGLFADMQAMIQYLTLVFKIIKIDKVQCKDTLAKETKKDLEKYLDYTLVEYLNDNLFLFDIYKNLNEVQTFLSKDDNKPYKELTSKLKNSSTDITIKQTLETLKNLNKDILKDADKMHNELRERNKSIDIEVFKSHLLSKNDNDLLSVSLEYANTISDFYRDQIILRGVDNEQKTPKK